MLTAGNEAANGRGDVLDLFVGQLGVAGQSETAGADGFRDRHGHGAAGCALDHGLLMDGGLVVDTRSNLALG